MVFQKRFPKGGEIPAGISWQTRRFAPPFGNVVGDTMSLCGRACSEVWVWDNLAIRSGQLSSVVEQRFCKPSVVGSNPTAGSTFKSS